MLKVTLKPDVEFSPFFLQNNNKDGFYLDKFTLKQRRGKVFVYLDKDNEANIPDVMFSFVDEVLWEKYFDLSCGETDVNNLNFRLGRARAVFRRTNERFHVSVFSKSFEDFLVISSVVKGIIERARERFEYKQLQITSCDLISQKEVLKKENERYSEIAKELEERVTLLKELVGRKEKDFEKVINQARKEQDSIQAEHWQANDRIRVLENCILADFIKRNQE